MKERPIIMGAESVRAILEGRKTQTRRVVGKRALERFKFSPSGELLGSFNESHPEWEIYPTIDDAPYKVGDRLWVRESYCGCWGGLGHSLKCNQVTDAKVKQENGSFCEASPSEPVTVFYRANGDEEKLKHLEWKSPLFMPRWASRITLEITDIRVERVQDITEEDVLAEGVISNEEYESRASEDNLFPCPRCEGYQVHETFGYNYGITEVDCTYCDTQKKRYRIVWDSLNAKRGYPFESNPWVWVLTFKVVQ